MSVTVETTRLAITLPEQWEALCTARNLPETELVHGCGPYTSWYQAKKMGVLGKLSEWSRENSIVVDVLMSVEMATTILGVEIVDPSEAWDFFLGAGKNRKYYRFLHNQRNRQVKQSGIGTPRKGMLSDCLNGRIIYGPQGVADCYGGVLTMQHRAIMRLVAEHMSPGEGLDFWLQVTHGIHPTLASRFDIPRVHRPRDNWFKEGVYFPLDLVVATREYVEEPFNLRSYQTDRISELLTVLANIWGRTTSDSFTASYHPGGSQAPTDDECHELADRIDMEALQTALILVDESTRTEASKPRLWKTYLSPPMVVTACVLASNRYSDPNDDIQVDLDLVRQVCGLLAETADSGEAGFSHLIRDIIRNDQGGTKKGKGTRMEGRDRRIFAGLVTTLKALISGEELPERSVPDSKEFEKMKSGKMGWPLFGGLDQLPAKEVIED